MTAPASPLQSTSAVRLGNTRGVALQVQLEPWGETFEMPPGAVFEIVANGPADGELHIDVGDDGFLVCGWPGSIVGILHDTEELGDRDRPRVPRLDGDDVQAPQRAVFASRYSGDGG